MSTELKLDTLGTSNIIDILYHSQLSALQELKNTLPQLQIITNCAVSKLQEGGRLVFVGAGTSGRLAAQESAELYPTFSWPKNKTYCLIAGGQSALNEAQEDAEDNINQALEDVSKLRLGIQDVVICVAASGKTPYTLAILQYANKAGSYTIGICCENNSPILLESKGQLFLATGEEAVSGSTRLAAGTAQKVILNTFTTTLMIKLGRVYDSFMVDLAITNKKLENRGINMVAKICNVDAQTATKSLFLCNKRVKLACVYLKCGSLELAQKKLDEHNNNLRLCLE